MRNLVIYSSQTGFTEKYAKWIQEAIGGDIISIKEAKKREESYFASFDGIVFGSWSMGGTFVDMDWFMNQAKKLQNKKVAVYGVGATSMEDSTIPQILDSMVKEEQKSYIKAFYFQGGLDYKKMNFISKLIVKTVAKSKMKQKDITESERQAAARLLDSFDGSNLKYIQPLVEYMKRGE